MRRFFRPIPMLFALSAVFLLASISTGAELAPMSPTIDEADDVADRDVKPDKVDQAPLFDVSDVDVDNAPTVPDVQPALLQVNVDDVSPCWYKSPMGNYHVSVQGVGSHGPSDSPTPHDVEFIAKKFVDDLRNAGHIVKVATVAAGGGETSLLKPRTGEDLYLVYVATAGGVNFKGDPCPAWADLPDAIRRNWDAVSHAAQYARV